LDKDSAGDAGLVTGISADDAKKVYADATTFKKNYTEVSYKSQQGAMVVDHWVHYDGFMVVEMGEVKTRW
jgi:radical SAM superfamily enzyme with C-terminal helix-hairpin-helix motif